MHVSAQTAQEIRCAQPRNGSRSRRQSAESEPSLIARARAKAAKGEIVARASAGGRCIRDVVYLQEWSECKASRRGVPAGLGHIDFLSRLRGWRRPGALGCTFRGRREAAASSGEQDTAQRPSCGHLKFSSLKPTNPQILHAVAGNDAARGDRARGEDLSRSRDSADLSRPTARRSATYVAGAVSAIDEPRSQYGRPSPEQVRKLGRAKQDTKCTRGGECGIRDVPEDMTLPSHLPRHFKSTWLASGARLRCRHRFTRLDADGFSRVRHGPRAASSRFGTCRKERVSRVVSSKFPELRERTIRRASTPAAKFIRWKTCASPAVRLLRTPGNKITEDDGGQARTGLEVAHDVWRDVRGSCNGS